MRDLYPMAESLPNVSLVRVGDIVAATINGDSKLCVVISEVWNQPRGAGRWMQVTTNHGSHWIQERDVTDLRPLCFACAARRLFRDLADHCTVCDPPFDWQDAWRTVLSNVHYLVQRDPGRSLLAKAALRRCDEAFSCDDVA